MVYINFSWLCPKIPGTCLLSVRTREVSETPLLSDFKVRDFQHFCDLRQKCVNFNIFKGTLLMKKNLWNPSVRPLPSWPVPIILGGGTAELWGGMGELGRGSGPPGS